MFKFDPAPHNGRFLMGARKGKMLHIQMDSGKTYDNTHISYIELKKLMDSLV